MKVLVLGSTGQVGSALVSLLRDQAIALDFPEVDLSTPGKLPSILDRFPCDAVINAAAYTQVDRAEREEDLARAINGEAPGVLAKECCDRDIPFIHYSTDYVFSGEGTRPWREEDPVSPLSAYGRTKLLGEKKVAEAGGKWLVFRTSWVYDAKGKNFLNTMLRLAGERDQLRVVSDQRGAPTYAPHLAAATLQALESASALPEFPSGSYHLCNAGETGWNEFAREIFESAGKSVKVEAIFSADYPTPARRPLNSRLDTGKAKKILGVALPDWREGLRECMREKMNASH